VFDPPSALIDLIAIGAFVQTPFAPRFVLEVFDRVCEIDFCPIDADRRQGAIEEFAGGAYKDVTSNVFLIARLFPRPA